MPLSWAGSISFHTLPLTLRQTLQKTGPVHISTISRNQREARNNCLCSGSISLKNLSSLAMNLDPSPGEQLLLPCRNIPSSSKLLGIWLTGCPLHMIQRKTGQHLGLLTWDERSGSGLGIFLHGSLILRPAKCLRQTHRKTPTLSKQSYESNVIPIKKRHLGCLKTGQTNHNVYIEILSNVNDPPNMEQNWNLTHQRMQHMVKVLQTT